MAMGTGAQGVERGPDTSSRNADWPIFLVVPFPPGGSADRIGRIVAAAMSDAMKRSVTGRNIPTGVGVDALASVARPVDGEIRLGYATSTQVVQGTLINRIATYNVSDDFEWIGVVGTFGNALIAGPRETTVTFDQWLKEAPLRPRPVRIGAGAAGSMGMLAAEFLAQAIGGRAELISILAADAGYSALRTGEIDVYIDGVPNALEEAVRAGGTIMAVTSRERAEALPQVPSFGERWPTEDFSPFVALVVARKESEAIRARLKSGWYGVQRGGKARAELTAIGVHYLGLGLEAAPAYVEDEFLRHAKLLGRVMRAP